MEKLPTYRLTVTDDQEPAITFTAFVEDPAIQSNFMMFGKTENPIQFKVADSERRIITGPVMIPDQMIFRSDKNGPYYVYYTKQDVEKVMKAWAKHGKHNAVNEDHNAKKQPEGVYLVESFMTDANRGINAPSVFTEQFPDGTWFHSYYVENDEVWERAKKGEYKGFSVEGYFDLAFSRTHNVGQDIAEIQDILNKIG